MEPGSRVGPYEVLARLGRGGMGEVWRARDTRLGRDVAIKLLPLEVAADPDRLARFDREARAMAALSHPNVVEVFDVGTLDGAPYLVEELLDGGSLRERIDRGALPLGEALKVAIQIARGLAAAHQHQIVHRDLKPENVVITRGGAAKIVDFGLAKLMAVPGSAEETLSHLPAAGATQPGRFLGTAPYMAPEQVRGEAVDPRTDVFALGVVFHEMLSGRRPFEGETLADTVAAILTREPAPLAVAVPASVASIARRCLEKRPDDRFESAHDLAFALESVSEIGGAPSGAVVSAGAVRRFRFPKTTLAAALVVTLLGVASVSLLRTEAVDRESRASRPPRVVVLPFENLGSAEDAYFAAGIGEEITSRLANLRGLAVVPRASVAGYQRAGAPMRQIAADLAVDYVLEGSLRWERKEGGDNRVRITPQLTRVRDDTLVWSERYDRVVADILAVQADVAENAVRAMGVALLPRERIALREASTSDLEAYDLYLRGQEALGSAQDRASTEAAVRAFQAAVDRDPRFARALAALSLSHLRMYWMYFDRSPERVARAREAAERAVELRPDLAATHIALGNFFYQAMLDYPRALERYGEALRLQPNDSDSRARVGPVYRRMGRWVESARVWNASVAADPGNAAKLFNLGECSTLAREYAEADEAYSRAQTMSPEWGAPYGKRAWLQVQWRGDLDRAQSIVAAAENVPGLRDEEGYLEMARLQIALARGDVDGAMRLIDSGAEPLANQFYYLPRSLLRAETHLLAGRVDLAARSFEAARSELEAKVSEDATDSRVHSALGVAYAGLRRAKDAIREARAGCELMPSSADAWRALYRIEDLAQVYSRLGNETAAIARLEELLAASGEMTPQVLRVASKWRVLDSDPRFRELLKRAEVIK